MKMTVRRIVGYTAVIISAASLLVSIAAYRISSNTYQASRTDKEVERRLQQHAGQVDKKSQVSRTLREFRSLSYLYFFAETASQDRAVPELENRHVDHHRLEAQLISSLGTLGDSFGPCVRMTASEFREYLGTCQWEQQIQNADFHEKIRNDPSGKEDVGHMISRAVFVKQFDYLAGLLDSQMDKEMVSTDPTAPVVAAGDEWWELPCETFPFSVTIATSDTEIKVNERTIFTANVQITDGYMYTCDWSADEAHESTQRQFACHFTGRGVKIVNLTVSVYKETKDGIARNLVKTLFARNKITVN